MAQKISAPYGSWRSPISAEWVAASSQHWINQLYAAGENIYLLLRLPEQGGRSTVARLQGDGHIEQLTPATFDARTRVYEYGGSCFAVNDSVIYFSNFPDDRLYRHLPGESPRPITAAGDMRYADLVIDHKRNRLICIREDHTPTGEPKHTLAAVNLDGDEFGAVLFDQTDFVAFPVLSQDGRKLAWVAWNHPNMPFFSSSLWAADVDEDGSLTNIQQIVPEQEESVTDPRWSPNGDLYFCSDRSNWWNLYRWQDGEITAVSPMAAELGNPYWNIGKTMYRFLTPSRVLAAYNQNGTWHLAQIDTETGTRKELITDFTYIVHLEVVGDHAFVVAGSSSTPRALFMLDLISGEYTCLASSVQHSIPEAYISPSAHISYPTENGLQAHGFYHPPHNPEFEAPAGELPPLIVIAHGGPTGSVKHALDIGVQFYTSRGFAVLEINYGGSAGYGREYRNRLRGEWGVVDVDDAVNGARYLVQQGLADGERTIVRGGSAGGFTTFAALAFRDVFKAGSSHYGISDLEFWDQETHKFEAHYCRTLIGPYPEQTALYRERSPIHRAGEINVPLLIFQGLDDKVVPPNQSRFVADALRARGVPVAHVEFEGEAHGFRFFETNVRVHQTELAFFGQVFGFDPADELPPMHIDNLDGLARNGNE